MGIELTVAEMIGSINTESKASLDYLPEFAVSSLSWSESGGE
jgi:hypothetical protein